MESEVTIVRIYLSEADHGPKRTLMQDVLNILSKQHKVKGVTVFRGIAGFGNSGQVHASDMLRIMVDLPIVIEFFDTPQVAQAVLTVLRPLIPDGRIISWSATCR